MEMSEVTIPSELMSQYRNFVVGADVMYIIKLPFFVTMSRNIKFSTAELMIDRKHETLVDHVKQIQRVYMKRGFRIRTFLMDGQCDVIRGDLSELNITLNTGTRGKHIPEVERQIRTIKESVRCVYATLPFTKIPNCMLAELVYFCAFWLNSFPAHDRISDTLSPWPIVTGSHIDFNKHARLEFGAYIQTHEEHDNTMATRTTGAIALRPTGSAQGGFYLYSLSTGRVLNRNQWTALLMPREVINRVHVLARRSTAALTFADRDGVIIPKDDDDVNTDDDSNYAPNDDSDNDDSANDRDNEIADDEHGDNADNPDDAIDPDAGIAGLYNGHDDANFDDNSDANGDNHDQPPLAIPGANPNDDEIEGAEIETELETDKQHNEIGNDSVEMDI